MANTKRKRSRPTAAPGSLEWKKVDVGLLAPNKAAAGSGQADDNDFENAVNHYDTPESRTYRTAERDLEAGPKEGVGFFFGLEVLDGSQYSVVEEDGSKRIVMKPAAVSGSIDTTTAKIEEKPSKKATSSKGKKTVTPEETDEKAAAKKEPEKKKKKSKRKVSEEMVDANRSFDSDEEEEEDPVKAEERQAQRALKKKLKKKKNQAKKKEKKKLAKKEEEGNAASEEGEADETQLYSLQTSWMTATGGVTIRPELCKSLLAQSFWTPTPIQAASLPAATLGRRNIVGAAPTGSGKTLAYLIPIFEHLLHQQETNQNVDNKIQALVLAPTRELALQVQKECNKLIPGKCGALVGGMSTQKQERILRQNKHPIIVATPGRLWEMISSREHEHLNDLSQITFLVIDECDRMTEQGSFPQLHSILDAVEKANPMDDDDSEGGDMSDGEEDDDPDRMMSLPGIRGEAKVVMLNDDLLTMIEQQRTGKPPEPLESDSDSEEDDEEEADDGELFEMDDAIELPVQRPVDRQTFVYSATLTLPPSASYIPSRNRRKKRLTLKGLEGAIEEILDKARARGQTKVIDLSNSKKQAKFNEKILETQVKSKQPKGSKGDRGPVAQSKFNLPPGLKLQELKCTQLHKDGFLYAYLLTTREGASGPSLVFCNSIVAVKRVGETLKLLGLPVRVLHANMQQRARFKSVESLQKESRAVVVATDVAARGLDIPDVATVVHYDVARKVDGFVHRAGRTARGMGEKAVGSSMSLISPAEERAHTKILLELNVGFEAVQLDSRLLTAAQERVNLASKISKAEDVESKAKRSNQWFIDSAKEAGLEIDDEVFEDGLAGGNQKDQQQLREAKRAKGLLQRLLAEPMVTQRYGKFLSSNTAAQKTEVAPYVVQTKLKQPNKKKRKKNK